MLEYVVIIGLIVIAAYWIFIPLLKSDQLNVPLTPKTEDKLRQLRLKKERVYDAIRELEFDLNMGKLSKEDHETLKRQYKLDVVRYLKEIDTLQSNKTEGPDLSKQDIENEIEREVSALRGSQSVKEANLYCTQCGARSSTKDRFCSKCGAKLDKP